VGDDQRARIAARGPRVQEVDAEPVDDGPELAPPVQLRLEATPVVLVEPRPAQLGDRVEPETLPRIGRRLGQAHPVEAIPEVLELVGRDVEHERHHVGALVGGGLVGHPAHASQPRPAPPPGVRSGGWRGTVG
jgi:hypothetical protein